MNLRTAYRPVPEDNVLRCLEETDENLSDDITIENEHQIPLKFVTYLYVQNGKRIITIYLGSHIFMETWSIALHMQWFQ